MRGTQVVVTGAGGFIGRWLVRELLHQGARVTAMVRRAPVKGTFPPDVCLRTGDVTHPDTLRPILAGAEVVFHGAGLYRFGMGHQRTLNRVNADGTANLLDAARHAGTGCIVHLSSAGILDRPQGLIGTGDFPQARPRWSAYKGSKWQAEQIALDAARSGLPVRIASITCPLGSEDHGPTPTGRMVLDWVEGRFPFSARTGLNFIGIRDLARGLIAVAQKGQNGQRYLLGQENLTLTAFLQRLAALDGKCAPRLEIPWPLIAAGGLLGECAHLWNPNAGRRLCLETALQAARHQFFDVLPSQQALDWSPADPLDDALRESLAWFRNRHAAHPAGRPATAEPHVA